MQRPRHAPTHHARTRHATETWAAASGMHARVVGAVIMRDLQTRFGAGYFGFLLGLMMPLGHLAIALVVNFIVGRKTPLGTNVTIFLMTGVLPFVLWLYSHRQIMMSLHQNIPLLSFPGVDVLDIFIGRFIVEFVNGSIVVSIAIAFMYFFSQDINVNDISKFLYSLIASVLLGFGTGVIFGSLGYFNHMSILIGNLLGPIMWVMSGIFFIPDDTPEIIRIILSFNPLSHIIDSVRTSYYAEYSSSFASNYFIISAISALILTSISLATIVRRSA
ncbi:ABC transporter permease [Xanthobacter wiegelii]|uniref:ABC transporter permease n=1 Tax=Xanthobacter wiegelii TaxID=3119913 RepID=UPI0037295F2A